MLTVEILERQNKRLREENDELREEVRSLRAKMAGDDAEFPLPSFLPHFTPYEGAIFRQLMTGRVISRGRLLEVVYPDGNEPNAERIIDVFICRIRAKLAEDGHRIINDWGRGWYLDDDLLARLGVSARPAGEGAQLIAEAVRDAA